MDSKAQIIDDQPISAGFYNEGNWLSDYITPFEPDIQMLWEQLGRQVSLKDNAISAWDWVANEIRYKPFIKATINVEGKTDVQEDFWQTPSMCAKTRVGNCVNKSFLLTSLLRNVFPESQVYCVLGNLYNGCPAGHAWVEVKINGIDYILESTRDDVPLLEVNKAERYEPVHYVNDKSVYAIPGRTTITPFSACYSTWLRDYLHWAYINGGTE